MGSPPPLPENIHKKLKTQTEIILWNHLQFNAQEARKKFQQYEEYIKVMNEKIDKSMAEKNEATKKPEEAPQPEVTYETDEEQLARDTDWIKQKRKPKPVTNPSQQPRDNKKRKAEGSPVISPPKPGSSSQHEEEKKPPLPPPIFVQMVQHVNNLLGPLKTIQFQGKITPLATSTSFKISSVDGNEYRKITKLLTEGKFSWHTFSDVHTRPLKVMARGIHHLTDKQDIVDDLKNQGYKIIDVTNILNWKKEPMHLHMLTFENSQDVKKVFAIKRIAYQTTKIEELKKSSKRIVQCQNCQGYNHTRSYCHKPACCVKCAGPHPTAECKKSKDIPPKCANCKEPHTANYRGCIVAKELQKLRNQGAGKQQKLSAKTRPIKATLTTKPNKVDPKITFADVVIKKTDSKPKPYTPASVENILVVLERLERKVDQQEQFKQMVLSRLTYIENKLAESEC